LIRVSMTTFLQSRQPMPAVRQASASSCRFSFSTKALCRVKTGQSFGSPGSERRRRLVSVTIGAILARMISGPSLR